MVDSTSLGGLPAAVLGEAVAWLHGQITELLKHGREDAGQVRDQPRSVPGGQPGVLDGPLVARPVDRATLAGFEGWLRQLRAQLADYVDGVAVLDPGDQCLLEQVAALRGLLEWAYGQHVTFRGERRPATGSPLPAGGLALWSATWPR